MENITNAKETLLQIKEVVPFFDQLQDDEILKVAFDIEFRHYKLNEVIFEQDEEGEEAFIVIKGGVDILVGKFERIGLIQRYTDFKTVTTLSTKTLFGEMSAITTEKRSARAVANAPDTLLLSFKIVDEINEDNATIFIKIYKELVDLLSQRLRKTNEVALKKGSN